jgi:hypothetical protein
MADRLVIAEKMQNGKMTIAEGNAAISARWSQAVSEAEQRTNARNSVISQQNAANAQNLAAAAAIMQATRPPPVQLPPAAAPVVNPSFTCIRNGNVTTCN